MYGLGKENEVSRIGCRMATMGNKEARCENGEWIFLRSTCLLRELVELMKETEVTSTPHNTFTSKHICYRFGYSQQFYFTGKVQLACFEDNSMSGKIKFPPTNAIVVCILPKSQPPISILFIRVHL